MGSFRKALVFMASLSLIGCASTDQNELKVSSSGGIQGDKAKIQQSLETMDEMDDAAREIARSKMDGLIDQGLYDPENVNPLKVGEPAPDFELMPLRFYDFAIGQGIDQTSAGSLFEAVSLSSFKGSLPVVLIFGSYT
ncbi:MAG: hypothetical protein O7G85_05690 [Planctomycetota bacterium]|nr:hypothetical protein [Planctomycetota bacterium]